VRARTDSGLRVRLESSLPRALPVGRGSAVFCYGHCFALDRHVERLELRLDGVPQRPLAARMPRRDLFEALAGGPEDPEGRSYRSGFWATLSIPPRSQPGVLALDAVVALEGATTTTVRLGRIDVVPPQPPPAWGGPPVSSETILICMATCEPDLALFETQIESLRAQSDPRWVCLISDDATSLERYAQMVAVVGEDPRFVLVRARARSGPYRNFERALAMAPAEARLFALCDQDDRWYPDKLAALREALGGARLAYSDLRLVDRDHRVLRDSLWEGRRNDPRNLASLLVANCIPGAAMLFTREVAELALPFPEPPGFPFHDHWLALTALAAGEIAYVDRPLYDYVQHADAVSGDLLRRRRARSRAARWRRAGPLAARRWRAGSLAAGWRAGYFAGYLPRKLQAQTLLLRCEPRLTARHRRALRWFVAADHRLAGFLWLAARPLRRLIGRDETLSGEAALVGGIMWRWLIGLLPARSGSPHGRRGDASLPDPALFEQPRLRRWRAGW
jgi:glycosyltransferase involved in cell wall biosynthesis